MITKKALSGAFSIEFNMNDTFYWGCADRCKMHTEDFFSLEPLYEKYGYDLIIAYEALNRGHDSEHEEVCSSNYFEAKKEISSRLSSEFCPHLFKVINEREDEKRMFNGQEVHYKNYKRTFKDKVVSFLKREKYIPI